MVTKIFVGGILSFQSQALYFGILSNSNIKEKIKCGGVSLVKFFSKSIKIEKSKLNIIKIKQKFRVFCDKKGNGNIHVGNKI